uniref:Sperm acrosome membrane-associated protein 4 n=1 Tax=Geotrypetes seraphini TaxID=260995 RepID=A0A6P8NU36_GEOSA|nr:sperm acrosome membrane-associated protein 4 [Geotrypetes seraphini]
MEHLGLLTLVAFVAISQGNALVCYRCQVILDNDTMKPPCPLIKMLCGDNESCASYTLSATNRSTTLVRGCLETSRCNNITTKVVKNVEYSMQASCCDTELCNTAAGALQVSLFTVLALMLLWIIH